MCLFSILWILLFLCMIISLVHLWHWMTLDLTLIHGFNPLGSEYLFYTRFLDYLSAIMFSYVCWSFIWYIDFYHTHWAYPNFELTWGNFLACNLFSLDELYPMLGVLSDIWVFLCCRLVIYFHPRFGILLAYLFVCGFNSKGNVSTQLTSCHQIRLLQSCE